MSLMSYYDGREKPESGLHNVLAALNVAFAIVALLSWSSIAPVLTEPLRWATESGISASPGLFEYPYMLTWLLPMLGFFASSLAHSAHARALAVILGLFPTIFIALIVGWFYLAPLAWH